MAKRTNNLLDPCDFRNPADRFAALLFSAIVKCRTAREEAAVVHDDRGVNDPEFDPRLHSWASFVF